jgi:hypothetical protein
MQPNNNWYTNNIQQPLKNLIMKNLKLLAFITCFTSISSFAQTNSLPVREPDYNKPRLFQQYGEKIAFSTNTIDELLKTPVGTMVETTFGNEFLVTGQVLSVTSKFDNQIRCIVIRVNNFSGAALVLSKITNNDSTMQYTGRMISKEYGDLYMLQQDNGQYQMVKKNYTDIVAE